VAVRAGFLAAKLAPTPVVPLAALPLRPSSESGAQVPESGLPIRVYREHDMWHVDYGEGVTEEHASREEAESAAEEVAGTDERTVVVEE
jgi:hypothetical protein